MYYIFAFSYKTHFDHLKFYLPTSSSLVFVFNFSNLQVSVPIISNRACQSRMEVNLFDHAISDLQICAGDPIAKKDTCEVGVILTNWQNLYLIIFNKLGQLIT
jgi:hypothetical protein